MKESRLFLIFIAFGFMLSSCAEKNTVNKEENKQPIDTRVVLATVYGKAITEADVDFVINRTFSAIDQAQDTNELRYKVLQSLIASRAMSHHITHNADEDVLTDIDAKTAAYREELYVKEYLEKYATPEPVSTQMVVDYYQNNLPLFGAKTVKTFELLSTKNDASVEEKNQFINVAIELNKVTDWSEYSNQHSLEYKQLNFREGLLTPALENALQQLGEGDVSNVIVTSGTPTLLRVIRVNEISARPLAEVSADIRQRLAPLQIKKAVKAATENIMNTANVVFIDQRQ